MDTFTTCTTCAVVIVNGDDSVWDDMTDDQRASADAAIDIIGMYEDHEVVDHVGYFDCWVCDMVDIGTCHEFSRSV